MQASRWHHVPSPIPAELQLGFEAQIRKPCVGGFEAQTTKPSREVYPLRPYIISTHVSVVLDCLITKSACSSTWLGEPSSWLGQHGLLLCMYSDLLISPSVSQPQSIFHPSWSLGLSLMSVLHRSQSIDTAHLYLTFSISVDHLCALRLHTNIAKRHVAHTLMLGFVSNSTEALIIFDNHSSQTRHTRACINFVFAVTRYN
jgi:hypothetical protein